MKLTIKSRGVYVPTWLGNDTEPEETQVRFHWRALSVSERQDLYELEPTGNEEQPFRVNMPKNALFIAMTERIENLVVDTGEGEMEITSAKELCETPGMSELYTEVYRFYQSLDSVDKKK